MSDWIATEISQGVMVIRLDRPEEQNRLTSDMYEAMADALVLGEANADVRVIMFAGAPGCFSAGSDREEFVAYADHGAIGESVLRFLKTLATVDKPLLAAVDGPATGIGAAMLLHCDYVVASEWSVFATPFVDQGLVPEAAASLLAPMVMGYHRAFELIVLGESFDARRAYEAGLVNLVTSAEEVDDATFEAGRIIAAKPPEAVRMARNLMRGHRRDVVARIDAEAGGFSELLRSREARDAFDLFLSQGH